MKKNFFTYSLLALAGITFFTGCSKEISEKTTQNPQR